MPPVRRNRTRAAGEPATPTSPKRPFDYATWSNGSLSLDGARREAKKRGMRNVYRLNLKSTMAKIRKHDEALAKKERASAPLTQAPVPVPAATPAQLLNEANIEIARLNGEVDRLSEANSTLHTRITAASQVVPAPAPSATNDEVQQLRDEIAGLRQANGNLHAQVTAQAQTPVAPAPIATNDEILQLRAEVAALQEERGTLRERVARRDRSIKKLDAEADELHGAKEAVEHNLGAKVVELVEARQKLEAEIKAHEDDVAKLSEEKQEWEDAFVKWRDYAEGLEAQLNAQNAPDGSVAQHEPYHAQGDAQPQDYEHGQHYALDSAQLQRYGQHYNEDDAQPEGQGQHFHDYQALVQPQQDEQQRHSGLEGLREEMEDEQVGEQPEYGLYQDAAKIMQEERERHDGWSNDRFHPNSPKISSPVPYDIVLDNLQQELPRNPEQSLEVLQERYDAFMDAALQEQEEAERQAPYMQSDDDYAPSERQDTPPVQEDADMLYHTPPVLLLTAPLQHMTI